jgi:hypothetical protein
VYGSYQTYHSFCGHRYHGGKYQHPSGSGMSLVASWVSAVSIYPSQDQAPCEHGARYIRNHRNDTHENEDEQSQRRKAKDRQEQIADCDQPAQDQKDHSCPDQLFIVLRCQQARAGPEGSYACTGKHKPSHKLNQEIPHSYRHAADRSREPLMSLDTNLT